VPKPKTKISSSKSVKGLVKAGKFKLDKTLLAVIVLVVVATGGYLFFTGSHASPGYPPTEFMGSTSWNSVKASDGIVGGMECNDNWSATVYGPATPCDQGNTTLDHYTNKTKIRFGSYNAITGKFYPSSGWNTVNSGLGNEGILCSNEGYWFSSAGSSSLNTGFGPVVNGEIFRLSAGKWQASWATFSFVKNTCTAPGTWYNVSAM